MTSYPSSRTAPRRGWRLLALSTTACLFALPLTPAMADGPIDALSPDSRITERTLRSLATMDAPEEQKLWVYLTDKGTLGPETYLSRLDQVADELGEHARARRAKVLAPPFVDELDLPLDQSYVEALRDAGVDVRVESRWLNAVSGRASLESWRTVSSLPFVRKLTAVRGGKSQRPAPSEGRNLPSGARGSNDYGPSFDQLDEINIVAAHDLGLSGAGVRVAMLDTGYYQDHDAFVQPIANGQLLAQWDFINEDGETQDESGDSFGQHLHGTLTWSIVAGFDAGELVGAAYGADFLLAKTEDTSLEDPSEEDFWIAGMEWADANGADVISSSLGYKDWYSYEDLDGQTAVTTIGADIAVSRGIVVCTAMGNEGTNDWYFMIAPADANLTLSVGGTTPSGDTWEQSSHGPTFDGRTKPEVMARGSLTRAAAAPEDHLGEGYRDYDGTSVATPLVAGAAALLLEAHPEWTPAQVREALMTTADNAETPDNDRGWGRIDVLAALGYVPADAHEPALAVGAPRLMASPNPFSGRTTITLRGGFSGERGLVGPGFDGTGLLEVFSPEGRRVKAIPFDSASRELSVDAWDARGRALPPGIYLLRLTQADIEATTKLVVH